MGSTERTWPWLNGNTFCFERRQRRASCSAAPPGGWRRSRGRTHRLRAASAAGRSSRRLEEEARPRASGLKASGGWTRRPRSSAGAAWRRWRPTTIDRHAVQAACIVPLFGCTDSSAANFEADATTGSAQEYCDYTPIVNGCTDPIALNYNQNATRSSGCKSSRRSPRRAATRTPRTMRPTSIPSPPSRTASRRRSSAPASAPPTWLAAPTRAPPTSNRTRRSSGRRRARRLPRLHRRHRAQPPRRRDA